MKQAAKPQNWGLVVATHGHHCWVEKEDGTRLLCHARGKKSRVLVGDRVRWQASEDEGRIETVAPRRSCLYRQDALRTKAFAANVDCVLLLLAAEPVFSEAQLMRTLIAAHAASMGVLIGLNKSDLPTAFAKASARLEPYRRMGYPVLELSLTQAPAESAAHLHNRCQGKSTLVLGPSGSGKSTLIQLMVPQAQVAINSLSTALHTGRHTTTATTWYWVDALKKTALVDSAGFMAFGLHHLEATAIAQYLPDFAPWLGQCRFYNCTHVQEPGCAVLAQVGADSTRGGISSMRHAIYTDLLRELGHKKLVYKKDWSKTAFNPD